jgi:hypothetical protein
MMQGMRDTVPGALAGAIVSACVRFVQAASGQDHLESLLLSLRDKTQDVIQTGTLYARHLNASLCEREHPQDFLREQLGGLSGIIEALSGMIAGRDLLVRVHGYETVNPFWSEDLQESLIELNEEMEDIQETIALGLSSEFRNEVNEAIQGAQSAHGESTKRD